jgi:hypothetical protein
LKSPKGPDLWFQGCPNLIYYSKLYGNKPKITMKELQERRKEIDEQICDKVEILDALNRAVELIKSTPGFDNVTRKLLEQNVIRFIGKLDNLRHDWHMIDACCNELERKNKLV